MKYIITDTSIIRVGENFGTIQNCGTDKIEISNSSDFKDVFLLRPLNHVSFNQPIFIRAFYNGAKFFNIPVNVVQFISNSDTEISNEDNVENYLNNLLNGGEDNYNNSDVNDYLDDLLDGGNDNYDNPDADDYFNDLMAG